VTAVVGWGGGGRQMTIRADEALATHATNRRLGGRVHTAVREPKLGHGAEARAQSTEAR
jgi:hypothetical protein